MRGKDWVLLLGVGVTVCGGGPVFAQASETAVHEVKYIGREFMNPFQDHFPKETGTEIVTEEAVEPPDLQVDGVVWSSSKPLAIINGAVVGVGGVVEDAEIISIERRRVVIRFRGSEFDLVVP